jgi:hypothetical protein
MFIYIKKRISVAFEYEDKNLYDFFLFIMVQCAEKSIGLSNF